MALTEQMLIQENEKNRINNEILKNKMKIDLMKKRKKKLKAEI